MKKLLPALLVASASAFAQESGGADSLTSQLATSATTEIGNLSTSIGPILVAAFGIAVGFVAYKLIKRAINKA